MGVWLKNKARAVLNKADASAVGTLGVWFIMAGQRMEQANRQG